MSNRKGKHQYQAFSVGKLCRCKKGKYEKAECAKRGSGHEHHIVCKNCYFTNF